MIPKIVGDIKSFHEAKYMSLFIRDDKLLKIK